MATESLVSNIHTRPHRSWPRCPCKKREKEYRLKVSPLELFPSSFVGDGDWLQRLLREQSSLAFVQGPLEWSSSPIRRSQLPGNWKQYPRRLLPHNVLEVRNGISRN